MIDPLELARYAYNDDSFNGSVGTGTARWKFFVKNGTLEKSGFLSRYGVKFVKYWGAPSYNPAAMIPYLQNGNVCIIHIPGHFMAIAGYDSASNKYLVLDSAASSVRGTKIDGSWIDASAFTSGGHSQIDDGFAVLAAVGTPVTQNIPAVGSSSFRYPVYLNVVKGSGSVAFTDITDRTKAVSPGTMVRFNVTPASGYVVSSVVIGGTAQTILNGGAAAQYSFGMPEGPIGVDVEFVTAQTERTNTAPLGFNGNGQYWLVRNTVINQTISAGGAITGIENLAVWLGENTLPTTVKVFSYNGSVSNSVSGTPVVNMKVQFRQAVDNKINFATPLPAGKYVIQFTYPDCPMGSDGMAAEGYHLVLSCNTKNAADTEVTQSGGPNPAALANGANCIAFTVVSQTV